MGWFWVLIAVPFIAPFCARAFWKKEITWTEMGIQFVVVCAIVSGIYFGGRYSETSDMEVWNGQIIGKSMVRVSCRHSYQCNCYQSCSGSGSSRSCTRICSTCYDHSYDNDWRVYTEGVKGKYFNIHRSDRQGLKTPPRWTQVEIGDSIAQTNGYTNWVKGAKDSLFHDETNLAETYKDQIPEYPLNVYDYHRLDRVLDVGVDIPDLKAWNDDLSEELKMIGPNKQANIVVVMVNDPSENYAHALKNAWLGGKKNDIVVVVGVTEWPKVAWAHVFSWSKLDMVNVSLRDSILDMKVLDRVKFMEVVRLNVFENYMRRPMKEFEYLKDEIDPPTWVIVTGLILGIGLSAGLTWWFGQVDINLFGRKRRTYR